MPSTTLLSSETAPLRTLSLARLQLDQGEPLCRVQTQGEEIILYSLIGTVHIHTKNHDWGIFGGRRHILEPRVHAMRFPAGCAQEIIVELQGQSADLLVVGAFAEGSTIMPVAHREDCVLHQVGEGAHAREVRVLPRPLGYVLDCGETLNIPGGISSWPPHANAGDLAKFQQGLTTWEEVMFFVCPSPGIAVLDGCYADGTPVNEIIRVENGQAYPMPLGSHTCYAAPDSYLWYFWCYCGTALTKQYNRWATDVLTYKK